MSAHLPRWAWASILAALLLVISGIFALAQAAALSVSASPSTIDPSNGQTTTITYTNTVAVYSANVTVRNSSNVTVRSLVSYNMIGTNTRTTAWDGKNGSGQIVPAGQYTVVFAGNSKDGTAIPPATTIVTVTTTTTTAPPPSGGTSPLSISVSPSTIDATQGQTTTVTYTNTVSVYSASVTVRNSSSVTVRSLASYNMIGTNTRKATWDGKNSSGQVVPNGQYTVVFEGKTSTGAAMTPATATVSVTTTTTTSPPGGGTSPLSISVSPSTIDATQGQTTTVTYTNTERVYSASVTVRNSSSVTVKSLASFNLIGDRTRTTSWDGTNTAGQVVPNGQYTVVFEGKTSTGTALTPATATITVTTTATPPPPPPDDDPISPLSVSVSPGTVDSSTGQTTVTYTNTVSVYNPSLTVRNSSGTTVRSLISYSLIGTNTRTSAWDGKNDAGQTVSAGQYTVVFEGKTSTGAAIPPASAGVAVSSSAPTEYAFAINSITPGTIDATKGETTTISYTVPITCDLRVVVKNSAGTEVRTLTQISSAATGNRSITWDGKNTTGAIVANGTYTVTVESLSTTPTVKPASGTVTVTTSTVTPPPSSPPPPSTGGEKGQLIEGGGSANFAWLKNSGYKMGIAFQSPKSGAITQITLQWKKSSGYGAGNYGTYTFELQTNGAGNFPSGTVIGKATNINPITAMDGYADGAFHFPISASLTAGQIYHLVITNTDASPGTNWSSPNGLMTRVQTWDGTGNRTAYYSSGSWKPWSSQDNPWNTSGGNNVNGHHTPTMLTWSDGTTTGDPYYSAAISSGARFYGTSRAGQYIVWNGPTTTVSRIGVSVKRIGSPSGALIYHLERVGSGDLATGTIATAAQVGTVQTWVYATLPSAVTLTQGQSYRLWFESPGSSSSSNAYASSPVYGESRPSSWLEAGWGGTHCYYVSGSGSLSSSMKTADLSFSLQ